MVVRGEEMSAVESSGNIGQKLKNIILANMDMSNRTARLPREIREQMMTVITRQFNQEHSQP